MTDSQLWFEDLNIGDRWQSPSRTMTDAMFAFFAGLSGDNHPLHYDVEYARTKTPFGKPLAHGLLVMGMTAVGASPLTHRLHDSMIAFLEQGCRFLKPVVIGDTLYPEHEIVALEPKSQGRGLVRIAARIKNQRGEVVLDGFHLYLVRSRKGAPAPASGSKPPPRDVEAP